MKKGTLKVNEIEKCATDTDIHLKEKKRKENKIKEEKKKELNQSSIILNLLCRKKKHRSDHSIAKEKSENCTA